MDVPMAGSVPVLREPAHLVSSRAPYIWALGAVVRSLLLGAAVGGALIAWGQSTGWLLLLGYAVLAIAYCVLMPIYRYRVHRWESTETAVYTQSGWLTRERRIAPMSRVQTVDLQQTAVSRLFGLANVTVTTASAAGPLRVEALDAEIAERLVEELTRRSEDEAGDAT
jgi:membrane protein YdbS with pleckstrin-like domain